MNSAPLPQPGGAWATSRALHARLSGFYFAFYVAVALLWLVPDTRLERIAARHPRSS